MQTQTNTAGVAGFVMALVALFTFGLLAPFALIVSLAGLAREPKGLAVAGSVLAGLQCLVGFAALFAFSGLLISAAGRVETSNSAAELEIMPRSTEISPSPVSVETETPIRTARSIVIERVMAISPGVLIRIDSEAAFQAAMGPAVRLEGRANSVGESRVIQAVLVNVGGQWQIAELKIGADTVARDLGLLAGIE